MEHNNDAPSPIHDIDTDVYMAKSGRLEERPIVEERKKEWQHMKGHANQIQSHLLGRYRTIALPHTNARK